MLEGEEAAVRALFASIEADKRHRDVKVVASGPLGKRLFDDWFDEIRQTAPARRSARL